MSRTAPHSHAGEQPAAVFHITEADAMAYQAKLDRLAITAHELGRAIRDEGSHPVHHRQILQKHRREWPVLWRQIDRLTRIIDKMSKP